MTAELPRHTAILACLGTALLSGTATVTLAQETVIDAGTVVFTENRQETEADKVGSTVNVVTREEIEEKSFLLITDYLTVLPGISTAANGGAGQETSLFVRGLSKTYVKTLYNGIDISDVTAPQPQTGYQYYLASPVNRIEVLKGSQSMLYGSDAIAGVVAIDTTSDLESGVRHQIGVEGGSFGTILGSYGLAAANATSRFGFNIVGLHTDGISAADERDGNPERDRYQNVTADINFEHRFSDMFQVFGAGLYVKGRAGFDNAPFFPFFPATDNLTATNDFRQLAGRVGFNLDLADGRFRNTVSIQGMSLDREISGTTFDGLYEGTRIKADYQGAFDVNEYLTVQAGADYERQEATFPAGFFNPEINADFGLGGLWANAIISPTEDLTLTAGIRQDFHSDFGNHTTFRATGSWRVVGSGTRFHGSVGTGFRAPSLNELFGPFGPNPNLQPETSVSADFGIEQTFLGGNLIVDVTTFLINVDNLIAFTTMYNNVPGTTESRGVEASATWMANEWLQLNGAYTYTHSVTAAGTRNIRIPRHEIALGAVARPWEKWEISGTAKIALDALDTNNFELEDYILINAKLAYKPTERSEIYVRVENLLDQDYQTARGYGTPDFSIFGGFKVAFGD